MTTREDIPLLAQDTSGLQWVLRIGAFMCFVGHGAFGVITKKAWVPYFGVVGIDPATAYTLMPIIGAFDITMGCLMLITPRPVIAWWMVVWAIWTAALRPLSGESFWEAIERAGNYGTPAALLVLMSGSRSAGALRRRATYAPVSPALLARLRTILSVSLALLLGGHGALGVIGKPGIVHNYAALVSAEHSAAITPAIGWVEIAVAILILFWQNPAFLILLAVWKLATESLFVAAGSPFWEVVERGGSYAVPVALSLVTIWRWKTTFRHPESPARNL